jgi:hypothetical protein
MHDYSRHDRNMHGNVSLPHPFEHFLSYHSKTKNNPLKLHLVKGLVSKFAKIFLEVY